MSFSFNVTRVLVPTLAVFLEGLAINLNMVVSPYRYLDWDKFAWVGGNYRSLENMELSRSLRDDLSLAVKDVAGRLELPLLDLDAAIGEVPECFYDELHFNKTGQNRGARLLTDFLLAEGFDPR